MLMFLFSFFYMSYLLFCSVLFCCVFFNYCERIKMGKKPTEERELALPKQGARATAFSFLHAFIACVQLSQYAFFLSSFLGISSLLSVSLLLVNPIVALGAVFLLPFLLS